MDQQNRRSIRVHEVLTKAEIIRADVLTLFEESQGQYNLQMLHHLGLF